MYVRNCQGFSVKDDLESQDWQRHNNTMVSMGVFRGLKGLSTKMLIDEKARSHWSFSLLSSTDIAPIFSASSKHWKLNSVTLHKLRQQWQFRPRDLLRQRTLSRTASTVVFRLLERLYPAVSR
jgi:hypothetical protein